MSHTTVMVFKNDDAKTIDDVCDLRNAWGTAPVIWDYIAGVSGKSWIVPNEEYWQQWRNTNIAIDARIVFAMCFDRCFISRDNFNRAADAIDGFIRIAKIDAGRANHWPKIADMLRQEWPADVAGVCFNWTSVSRNEWHGEYNDEKEDFDPVDWSEKWELFDLIDGNLTATKEGRSNG